MTDTIHPGETWRRTVTISDGDGPVDPTEMTAVLCPEIPMTVTTLSTGLHEVSLTEAQTEVLVPGPTRWELWGRVGSDMLLITHQGVEVEEVCGP